jgi:hypothetical protein
MEVCEEIKLSPLNATENQSHLDIQQVMKALPKELMEGKELWVGGVLLINRQLMARKETNLMLW